MLARQRGSLERIALILCCLLFEGLLLSQPAQKILFGFAGLGGLFRFIYRFHTIFLVLHNSQLGIRDIILLVCHISCQWLTKIHSGGLADVAIFLAIEICRVRLAILFLTTDTHRSVRHCLQTFQGDRLVAMLATAVTALYNRL